MQNNFDNVSQFQTQSTSVATHKVLSQTYALLGVSLFPTVIGALMGEQKAKEFASLVGWVIAKELGGCDIDFSFTPVLDVNYGASSVIGDRAFHEQVSPVI